MAKLAFPIPPAPILGATHFKDAFGDTLGKAGGEQTVLTDDAVGAGIQRRLYKAIVTTSYDGLMQVKINGTVVGSDRVRPGKPSAEFLWYPARPVAAGEIVTVTYTQLHGGVVSFEAYLMAEDVTL